MVKKLLTLVGILVALALVAPAAKADTVFLINNPNAAYSGFTGPYAQVTVHLVDATHATVTFDSLTNGGFIYLLAGAQAADLNVNGPFTASIFSSSNAGITGFGAAGPVTAGGAGNVSEFGVFNFTSDSFDGFTHSNTQIVISLTLTSGSWGSSADVLTPNADGFVAAIHGFACSAPCDKSNGVAATGFAGNGEPRVPEPGTMALFGVGLLGLAALRRRLS